MNKKGFTLVELLAVIAILAILMLLIMPNVLGMYTKGRKNAFKVQVGNVIKAAETQKQADALSGKNTTGYCDKISSSQCTSDMKLDVTDSDVKYSVVFNNSGVVTSIAVEDSNYCYVNTTDVTNINPNNFVQGGHLSCSGLTCTCDGTVDQTPEPSYSYLYWNDAGGTGKVFDSSSKPSNIYTHSSVEELGLSQPGRYIRTKIYGDTVLGHEICLLYNNKSFCMAPYYWDTDDNTTMNKLKTEMESSLSVSDLECETFTYRGKGGVISDIEVECYIGPGYCKAWLSGQVECYLGHGSCGVGADGTAACW